MRAHLRAACSAPCARAGHSSASQRWSHPGVSYAISSRCNCASASRPNFSLMCGIAGIATQGDEPARELVHAMCDAIVHRGPDGEGIFVGPGAGLGTRRLAIIELHTGDQPVSNTPGTIQAVFNGEIYNYRELRQQLAAKGHSFRSTGDSEVIPHLYDCLLY